MTESFEGASRGLIYAPRGRGHERLCFTDISKVVSGRDTPMQCLTLSNQLGNELNGRFAGDEVVGMRVVCKSDKADVKGEVFFTNKAYVVEGIVGHRREHLPGAVGAGRGPRAAFPDVLPTGRGVDGALGPGRDHRGRLPLARSNLAFVNPGPAAARVLWWHALLFRMPPTIVLQAGERLPGEGYAAISGSCRALVECGFGVIVDASHNSLSDSATATKREQVLLVEPMARELLENFEGLGDLIGALREAKLDGVEWAVVGGNPADCFGLNTAWARSGRGDVAAVTAKFVSEQLRSAIEARDTLVVADERLSPLYALFVTADAVPLSVLVELKLVRPSLTRCCAKLFAIMRLCWCPPQRRWRSSCGAG